MHKNRNLLFFFLAAPGSLGLLVAATAPACAQIRSESIPPQALGPALNIFARNTGLQVAYASKIVGSRKTAGSPAGLTPEKTLDALLRDTGLGYRYINRHTITIYVLEPNAPPSKPRTKPLPAANTGTPALGGITVLSEVVVVGQYQNSYNATSSNGSTRTDTDLLDVPQSVSVITRKLMNDQQAQSLDDALANASSVSVTPGDLLGSKYTMRGFNATSATGNGVMQDGMVTNGAFGNTTPIWGVDSVEVLKGPEAILTGSGTGYGGTINMVNKQPQVIPIAKLSFGIGSYGNTSLGWDSGGALDKNQLLSYRLVAQINRPGGNANGYDGDYRNYYLAPTLRWNNGSTNLMVGLQRQISHTPMGEHSFAPNGNLRSNFPLRVSGASDDAFAASSTRFHYNLEQQLFHSDWTLRSRGEYSTTRVDSRSWSFRSFLDPIESGDMLFTPILLRGSARTYTLQNDISGVFSTGPLTHKIVAGVDYSHFVGTSEVNSDSEYYPFNIFTSPPLPSVSSLLHEGEQFPEFPSSELGYFLQDQVAIGKNGRWGAQLALRQAIYHTYGQGGPDTSYLLPNAGLVYKATPTASLYANAMRGFSPNTGFRDRNGNPLPPQLGKNAEAGVKFELLDNRLSLLADLFRVEVSNNPRSVPGERYSELGPGQVSKGLELELRGHLAEGVDISATYAYTTAETEDGSAVTGLPRHALSLWTGYEFQQPRLKRWSTGIGVFARSSTIASNFSGYPSENFKNPGNMRVNAHLVYTGDRWSANFGIRNVFDRRIYADSVNDTYAPIVDAGRNYMLTGEYHF